jgi:Bacterial Ig-like domain (group 3)
VVISYTTSRDVAAAGSVFGVVCAGQPGWLSTSCWERKWERNPGAHSLNGPEEESAGRPEAEPPSAARWAFMIDQGFRLVALCSRRVCGGSVGSVALAAAAGDLGVTSSGSSPVFAGFRFPREMISVAVRWYLRYGLSHPGRRGATSGRIHRSRLRFHGERGPWPGSVGHLHQCRRHLLRGGDATLTVRRATSRTTLTLSPASVKYGHETSVKITVAVAPQFSGTPADNVIITSGKATLCTVRLASATHTCSLPSKRALNPGRHVLTASYRGSADFAPS